MARVGGGGGPRWVWPLIVLLILIGLALLVWAFLAPPPAPAPQSTEQASTPVATPTASGPVPIIEITANPSEYYGKDVTVEGRITRRVGDQGLYLADREGGSELLAILDKESASTDLRDDDFSRFSGTIREVTDDEVNRLSNDVDKPTLDALSNEQVYLSVSKFEKISE